MHDTGGARFRDQHSTSATWPAMWPSWLEYGAACGVALLAVGIRRLLDPILGDQLPFATVFLVLIETLDARVPHLILQPLVEKPSAMA